MELNKRFNMNDMPVDVLWMDISHTREIEYFTFDPARFYEPYHSKMIKEINADGRKLVVITDPHIKKKPDYFLYKEGMELQELRSNDQSETINIFICKKSLSYFNSGSVKKSV